MGSKKKADGYLVKEWMNREVAYLTLPASRDDVLDILKKKRISGVPVIKGGSLAGIVTRVDLLKHPEEEQVAMLMSRDPVSIAPDAPLAEAAKLMLRHGIRRLPVTGTKNKLLGIITIADIVEAVRDLEIDDPVGGLIEPGTFAVWDEVPLPLLGRIFELGFLKAAPVLNRKEELVGVITDKDLIAASVVEDAVHHSDLSGTDEDKWSWESVRDTMKLYYGISKVRLPDVPLKNVMQKASITCYKNSKVWECAKKMRDHKLDQLPVVNAQNHLVGMLRDRDLLKALVKRAK